jgi:hypothetical protein
VRAEAERSRGCGSSVGAGAAALLRCPGRGVRLVGLGLLLTVLVGVGWSRSVAEGAVTRGFLGSLTASLEGGVPLDCGGQSVPPCAPGGLSGVNALAVDSGHLWVAERIEAGPRLGRSRVDRFDGGSGMFLGPQLVEEGGLSELDGGVGVGHVGGEERVYVGAEHEHEGGHEGVVAVFGGSGGLVPEGVWNGAHTPNKKFGQVAGIAVDGSSDLEANGDIFVATSGSLGGANVVDVFGPPVGGGEPLGILGQVNGTPSGPFARPTAVAVSPNGDLLVADGEGEECEHGEAQCVVVNVFQPVVGMAGQYVFGFAISGAPGEPFGRVGALAVDGEGDIYVLERSSNVVEEFTAAGGYITRLTGTPAGAFREVHGLAVDRVSGDLYVGDFDPVQKTGVVDVFGPSRVAPDVTTGAVSGVGVDSEGGVGATLNGSVDPLGEGDASCRFVWGTTKAFGRVAPCEPEVVPDGTGPVAVKAAVRLAPDTTYFVRLEASDGSGTNPGESSDDREFHTPGPGLDGESASEVASTAVSLNASIDPDGAPSSYYFQYGRKVSYEAEAPGVPGVGLGEGSGDLQVVQRVQGLSPGATYHFRVVVVSQVVVEGSVRAVSFYGPDQTFSTQGVAVASVLPDGRRWELVSPPDKHGALLVIGEEGGISASAAGGNAFTYLTTLPTEEGVKGFVYAGVQVLAERGAGGWVSQDISPPHATPTGLPVGIGNEYRLFSSDLSVSLVEPFGEFTSLAPESFPVDTDRTSYLRHDSTCVADPPHCYRPLLVGCPGPGQPCAPEVQESADVAAGTNFGGNPHEGKEHFFQGEARFVDGTSDLSHVLLSSRVALTATATGGQPELYEWSADEPPAQQLALVSLLPGKEGEEVPGTTVSLGFAGALTRHAISEDGARVVWSAGPRLYVRDVPKAQTVEVDLPRAQCVEAEECGDGEVNARFQMASADGSRIFFTDTQRLTADAGQTPDNVDLYECDIVEVADHLACDITDLSPAPGFHRSADVQSAVLGASEDGSWVYFVANGVLGDGAQNGATPGNCQVVGKTGSGSCNVYVEHDGVAHYIATVAGEDYPDWVGAGGAQLIRMTSRVAPNGEWFAFMSDRELTGYDNRDAVSGKPDEEVYLYHAESASAGSLVCASCDPSGARPVGIEYAELENHLVGGDRVWSESSWIAANVPVWTAYSQGQALYQSRYLSDQGRLFFDADSALVPQDINRNQDVYEYEPANVGGCSGLASSFDVGAGGCVSLISSGRAIGESAFLDASESGDDVFFLTGDQLVQSDRDTALDLYDAHVCSAGEPCVEQHQSPPACSTADSCRVAPSPQPSIFGAPSSATFSNPVSEVPPAAPAKPSKPVFTRKQRLAKALTKCKQTYKHSKKRRVNCEKQASKSYGPKKPARSKAGKSTTSKSKASGLKSSSVRGVR